MLSDNRRIWSVDVVYNRLDIVDAPRALHGQILSRGLLGRGTGLEARLGHAGFVESGRGDKLFVGDAKSEQNIENDLSVGDAYSCMTYNLSNET